MSIKLPPIIAGIIINNKGKCVERRPAQNYAARFVRQLFCIGVRKPKTARVGKMMRFLAKMMCPLPKFNRDMPKFNRDMPKFNRDMPKDTLDMASPKWEMPKDNRDMPKDTKEMAKDRLNLAFPESLIGNRPYSFLKLKASM